MEFVECYKANWRNHVLRIPLSITFQDPVQTLGQATGQKMIKANVDVPSHCQVVYEI